jgi:ferredoxin-NADP reductase/MOSC domain-containing protein YiiM
MVLRSINIGLTRTVEIKGQRVRTAYLKEPTDRPVHIGAHGLEGNETAVHTDAVYALAAEHYAFWAARLGVHPASWPPGLFGENLTIDGLDEHALRIGDRVRVGEQVELLVAGPRIPCFKLAWRMSQPESFVAEFAMSGRSGVYFAVAREGVIRREDRVTLLESTRTETVAEVAAMSGASTETSIAALRSLLEVPCLSQTVALVLRAKLARLLDAEEARSGRWRGWRRFSIARIEHETPQIRSFHLRPVDGAPLPRYQAGQFLTVRLPPPLSLQRPWSLSDYREDLSTLRITIKHEREGAASSWMHERARVGDVLEVRAPAGRFVLDRGGFRPVILIAAGVGITPLLAMLKAHVARGPDAPPVYLIYCARNARQQAFRRELDALAENSRAVIHHVLSEPLETELPERHYVQKGRLTLAGLSRLTDDAHIVHGGKRVPMPWYDCDVYLCGPASFQSSLLAQMAAQGLDPSKVHTESFDAQAREVGAAAYPAVTVVLARSQRTFEWTGEDGGTLLDILEHSAVNPEHGCRMGICHECRCRLIDGEVRYEVQPRGLQPGEVLICCARPASRRITLDL